ncbi:non-ribosomal peptide synthase/polyketide synthase [Brevibacillus laterosporus]|uniref:non-ribosomal peptide synthase/polyketide synthase n=1 Tax=Brevibacillus laterosporus TaxID=1465 RepID=UPI00215C4CCE|nr:non-ribosomal peptide synthase/polyketide synthase [Brevibacillus laterosporus]MCR8937086.1 non-ribosomal peptide synthase/polyketide synthase [Brevibacillus laterosporus]MCZ0839724.1 non-ribosomal peptide synthase/polyketide synthase [Brevibacillus laterosporus]MCZ0845663.1 non-ribosomal peptide synthase/polyketide synthase [Brevibacillus laterosporus]
MKKQDNIAKVYPLTPLQEGMLFHSIKDEQTSAYYLQMTATIHGDFDLPLFEQSMNTLIENYEVLRTVFVYQNLQRARQVVFKERRMQVYFEDITRFSDDEQKKYIETYKNSGKEQGFDLTKDVLMRAAIFQTNDQTYQFVWALHHIVIDGWGLGILIHKLLGYYATLKANKSIPREVTKPYSEYIKWLEKQNREEALKYWKNYLDSYELHSEFPKNKKQTGKESYELKEILFTLDQDTTKNLQQIANRNQATLSNVFHALWSILVSKYKNTDDVVFGSVVSGRPPEIQGIENMVGLFINTIPTRLHCNGLLSIDDVIKRARENSIQSTKYDYAPLYEIQSQSLVKQELIDHLVTFENYPDNNMDALEEALGFRIRIDNGEEQTTYDLNVVVAVAPWNEMMIKFSYNAKVYDSVFVTRMQDHLKNIVAQVINHPDVLLKDIPILTEQEKQQLVVEYNNTASDYPRTKTIYELFEEQAAKTPHQVAAVCLEKQLTYQELNESSNQLAHFLREKGVTADSVVSIMAEHSLELVVGILAILKSGATYLPIDPDYPEDRIQYLLEDSQSTILLTQQKFSDKRNGNIEILFLDNQELYQGSTANLINESSMNDLAYIIYTSGSTGNPKGAMITHQGLVNYIWWARKVYVQNETVHFPLYSSISFDLTVTSIFTPLVSGNTIYIYRGEDKVQVIQDILTDNKVGIIKLTPTHLKLIEEFDGTNSNIRRFIVGGENLHTQLASKIDRNFGGNIQIMNEYGPTETVVGCMLYVFDPNNTSQNSVPIGVPADNVNIYLLDTALQPVPIGSIGEMYIAGDGVARGYLNRPELTAEKFIENPFRPGERMYRTGDLARWLPDGNMEYMGRTDHQVKIRGHRIEMGEIEAKLVQHEMIKEAVVIVEKDESSQNVLYSYIVTDSDLPVSELREHVGSALPSYMIPSYFIRLEEIPLTSNGKVERKKLPKPDGSIRTGVEFVAPRTLIEDQLATIWKGVLNVNEVSVLDNFFELGGHSLKAMTVISQISKAFNVDLPLKVLFDTPTIATISHFIANTENGMYSAIEPVAPQEYYPVSSAQKRMYILHQLNEDSVSYNMPGALIIEGNLDTQRFEDAMKSIVTRHEALRTSFHSIDGEPVQKVHQSVQVEMIRMNSKEDQIEQIVTDFIKPFDLSIAPLLRVGLIALEEQKHLFLLDIHHIISDGVSISVFVEEFIKIYHGESLPELRIQYKDFAVWQNELFQSEIFEKQENYWINTLKGEIPVLQLPTDSRRPVTQSFEGDGVDFVIPKQLTSGLYDVTTKSGATLYMVLLSAYSVLLSKYAGQEEIIIGSPIAGRRHADVERIMGSFINTLAMRTYPEASKTLGEFIAEVKQMTLGAFEHQDYPFEALVDKLDLPRDFSRNPLFDTMLVLQNMDQTTFELDQLRITPYDFVHSISKVDMTLFASEVDGEIRCKLQYSTALFKRETIEQFVKHFQMIIRAFVENVEQKLAEIPLLTQEEQAELITRTTGVEADIPHDVTMYDLFESCVKKYPLQHAVVFGEEKLTYQDLHEKANHVAALLQERGVGANKIVGIMTPPSLEMMIGIMGIWRAGGAYLPIDPDAPQERISYMLEDSDVDVVVTLSDLSNTLPTSVSTLSLDREMINQDLQLPKATKVDSENLAYVIYTSGTTGMPKGVQIAHRNVINYVSAFSRQANVTFEDRTVLVSSYAFDLGYTGIFSAILSGSQLHVLTKDEYINTERLLAYMSENQITYVKMTPSLFSVIVQSESFMMTNHCDSLRLIVMGGEPIRVTDVMTYLAKYPAAQVMNHYGPTETTIGCITHLLTADNSNEFANRPFIGKPIANTQVYVLDARGQLVPPGIVGELCISGEGVSKGYLNQPSLTDEKFVSNPFISDTSMYRTGDLARYFLNGNVEFLGRADHQVKIAGYRIELGEIEKQIIQHKSIKEAVVIAEQEEQSHSLYAYFVSEQEITVSELREHVGSVLPTYMIPAYFVRMDKIPLTPNGKVDRKALPKPTGTIVTGVEYVAPRNQIEMKVSGIWNEVLSVNKIGVEDNFFELGGHSLKAMNMISKLNKVFQVEVPFKMIFENPTIAKLAQYITHAEKGNYSDIQPAQLQEYYPVSSAQKRMYILRQLAGADLGYNMPGVMYIDGKLDVQRFELAMKALVQRHESLRTSFHSINGEIVQRIHEEIDFSISNSTSTEDQIDTLITNFIQPFDFSLAPLLRVGVVKITEERHLFLVDMHHIIADGVSLGIFIKEFVQLYQEKELSELRLQYKDFATWQNEWFETGILNKQETYWLTAFAEEIPLLNLSTDFPRPLTKSFQGDRFIFGTGTNLMQELYRIANETGTTLYMVLLATYNIFLSKYSGQEDIIVGTPIAGRTHADVDQIMGMFVNTLALRNYPVGTKTFKEFIEEVKQNTLQAYENQDYPFEVLVEKLDVHRDLSRNPLFDTIFILQNTDKKVFEIENLTFHPYITEVKQAKFDLTLEATEENMEIVFCLEYCTKLFKKETIEQMASQFLQIVRAVTENPEVALSEISMLTLEERQQVLVDFNNNHVPYSMGTIHSFFEEQVEKTPDHIALSYAGQTFTYRQLNERANQLAVFLRNKGVQPEQIVGIMAERSFEMIVGIYGVLKSGAAYLPIDPVYPQERIQYLLEDSGATILLTQTHLTKQITTEIEWIDLQDNQIYVGDGKNLSNVNQASDLAYIIYTSGTTGKPKGVMIEHQSIINCLQYRKEEYGFTPNDKVLQIFSFAFDGFVASLFSPMMGGAISVLPREEEAKDPFALRNVIAAESITHYHGVPSLFHAILDCSTAEDFHQLRNISLGGEKITPQLVQKVKQKNPAIEINNEYGPTENSVLTTVKRSMKVGETITIGRPIANVAVYILDSNHLLQPVGVIGELCIGGQGLARGYLHRPELTEEKFVPNPFVIGERMYKTGDYAKWLPDGTIEYIGRVDEQVKIRGYRIEIGEIENATLTFDKINEAVVVVSEDTTQQQLLTAYFTAEGEVILPELRAHLAKELPEYMVPTYFVQLEVFPTTPNGKIDRKGLPKPEGDPVLGTVYIAAKNATEAKLVEIWENVLGHKKIGVNDNFFDLGGHSLRAMTVMSHVHKECGVELPLKLLFEKSTIAELATFIDQATKSKYVSIQPVSPKEHYPVSSAQKRMYILRQFDGAGTIYNMPSALYMDGKLDYPRFEDALQQVINRHEALRTSFHSINGEPVQRVHQSVELEILYKEASIDQIDQLVHEFIQNFDLEVAPLLRVGLIKIEEERHLFLMDMHHIVSDGVSAGILFEEFAKLYRGESLPELRIQYKDFAVWQNERFASDAFNKQESYWINTFAGEIPVLNLPTDHSRPTVQSFDGDQVVFHTGKQVMEDLYKLANETSTTLYMVLLAAFNVLLSKYSGQEELVIGSPIAGRAHPDVEKVMGMFVNTLALKNNPSGMKSFKAFLAEVQQNTLEAYENQDYPFELLVETLEIQRDLGRNPLFDIMFILQNMEKKSFVLDDLQITPHVAQRGYSKFDLTLEANEEQSGLQFSLVYSTRLFKKESIERMAGHFLQIIDIIAKQPDIALSEISLLSEAERQQIVAEFNETSTDYPRMLAIHQWFEEQVEKNPDHIAVVSEGNTLTYQELNNRANQVAWILRQKGVESNHVVGLLADRTHEMIIGIMGILKAGGAYLGIDPEYPSERISYMIEDCEVNIVLSLRHLTSLLVEEVDIILLDDESLNQGDVTNLPSITDPNDIAYIMYTSGSTGKPKGVMVEHRNVVRLVINTDYVEVTPEDRMIQTGAIGFDAMTFEIFGALLHGARLYLVNKNILLDSELLGSFLQANQITTMWLTSPLFNQLSQDNESMFASLTNLIVGGDVLSPKHINKVKQTNPNLVIWNGYGPTENTTFSTCFRIDEEFIDNIPIGKPISNSTAYILDQCNHLQPIGVPGELCVGGEGVARGYINKPELTAEKFVSNPFVPGEQMYRTGDLARWLPDGTIEYLGRIDQQVKIRGFRIEIGEIESVLARQDKVKESVITVVEDKGGQKALCAYYVSENATLIPELREQLAEELPSYMVPTFFVQLEKMPLTPNGKVDRRALPKPDGELIAGTEYVAPSNQIEEQLVDIWKSVLGVSKIGVRDNFFELGGHSLKAMTVISSVHKVFHVELPLKILFESPTIFALASYISGLEKGKYVAIQQAVKTDFYPVSSAQKRMYILHQFEGTGISYNVPGVMFIEGSLDYNRFDYAMRGLVNRHEALRTSFKTVNGDPVQMIHDTVNFAVTYQEASEDQVEQIVDEFIQPFDLEIAPLFRIRLVTLSEKRHLFLMDMHHIISDGVSMQIIIKEFAQLYNEQNLPECNIQYKDFAVWQNELFQSEVIQKQEEFWLNTFAGELPILNLQTDFPRPSVQSFEGDHIIFGTGKQLMADLLSLSNETGATLYMLLLAAYNLLLSKYTGQEEIVIGTPIAGRSHADVENIVGMFVNTLALKNTPLSELTFREFISEVKNNALEAFQNQDYPFENLVEKLQIRRDLSRNPLFDTMFSLGKTDSTGFEIDGLHYVPYEMKGQIAKFDISLDAFETQDEIQLQFSYCTKLFSKETIERWAIHYSQILQSIVANPDKKLSEISVLSESEKNQIVYDFNATKTSYPMNKMFHQLFEEQVKKSPNNIAVISGHEQLTYQELNTKANQLARILRQKGVQPERTVGIIIDRSLHMVVSMLAVLKAGGAYVPIDMDYPQDRKEFMLEDSNAMLLLTLQNLAEQLVFEHEVLYLDQDEYYQGDGTNLQNVSEKHHMAYIIYTSGTTGKPKGVVIEHQSYINIAFAWREEYHLETFPVRLLQMASFSFDVSAGDFARALLHGGQLVVCPNEVKLDPASLYDMLSRYQITIFESTPALVVPLMEYIFEHKLDISQMKLLIIGADSCSMDDYRALLGKFGKSIRIINSYGVTEACIDSSYYEQPFELLHAVGTAPIGKPLPNTTMYIMDQSGGLVPIGVVGELCIGGAGVAREYLNRPELTAEKFVDNPFVPGEKLYRSGDLAKWLPDGNIEFLGRTDHQVKIRGVRIELGEIESQMRKLDGLREVVVIAKEDQTKEKFLCAYMVTDREVSIAEIRAHLAAELPIAMIPTTFISLEAMPLTANGKIDKRSLPDPDNSLLSNTDYVAPRTQLESQLATVWQQVLGIDRVGSKDDFFALGGHSLRAMMVISHMHKEYQIDIPLRVLFEKPTIEEIAQYLESERTKRIISIRPAATQDYYPVSAAQRRMFILNQFDGVDISYNMPSIMLLEGKLDLVKLETAFRDVINRHESLRTSFEVVNGSPVQKIHAVVDFTVDHQVAVEEELEEIIDEFIQPFQLNKAPLLRVKLIQTRLDRYLLLVDTHHIISDGVSSGIIISELVELYQGNTLPELTIQYKDFSVWQHEQYQTEMYKKQEDHWVQTFADEIPVLNLPTDFPRPTTQSFDGDVIAIGTGKELMEGLYKIATDTGTTLYMVLLATYNVLLSKYSGQEDLIVGTPVTGRSHVDLENTVGMFVNTLAMRNKPARSKSFREFLLEVKQNALRAYENQDYPFEELVEKLELQRDVSRNPMFDTMFTLQNRGEDAIELDELRFVAYEGENKSKHSKFDLTFIATEERDQIMIGVEYCTKLYRPETIKRLMTNFLQIMNAIIDNPDVRLAAIELLTNAEKTQLLQEFNNTERDYQQDTTVHQLFEEQVRKTPDQVALIWDKKKLTYQELNERANQLARTLRNKGVVPNQLVAIMADRSVEMIIGIMGILKAGAAYVPIDPAYPTERIEYVLEDSGAILLLTQAHLFNELSANMMRLNLDEKQNYVVDGTNLTVVNQPTDLAYVIYTSGTTGKPKGVMIEHHSIVNCLQWRRDEYAFNPKDKALQIFSFAFDGFVASLFAPMLGGATSILPREEEAKDPFALRKLIASESITHYYGVPSLFNAIVDSATAEDLHQLRCVTLGGEKLSLQIVQKIKQKNPAIEINNEYGPTENSVVTTIQRAIEVDQEITIGRPLANVVVYIVNTEHHLQPIGVVGELCIAGRGLGRGYLNRPELTEEKFVANPFAPGERMYKTGDLAKWRTDGTIEYVGRVDEQVKVRGFRIEIGEIESTILHYHGVKEVVVTAQEDQHAQQYLCAYFVAEKEVVLADLRKFVSKELPAYMVPTYFVQLLELPTTANGKVDKRALPEPQHIGVAAKEYVAPRNMIEEQLAAIWQEVLEIDPIGITDQFFEIGGHSLKAMHLISKVYEYMQEELPLHLVFQHPTIEKMAEFILHKQYEQNAGHPILLNKETIRPVFSFTPIGAHSTFYQKLAEEIHDISLYSFDFIEEDNRIEQYVNAIIQIDSEGPYTLMGYSSGGNLAFEVAKELETQGHQVSSIILFDSYWKDKAIEQTAAEARKEIEAFFTEIGVHNEMFNMTREDLELFITNDFVKQGFIQNMLSYLLFHNQLVNEGTIKAAIHLIQSECELGNVAAYEAEKWNEEVWSRASEQFITYRGYGDHSKMLSGEQVPKNASILQEILQAIFVLK